MPSAFRGRALATLVQGIPINSSGSQVEASALSHATPGIIDDLSSVTAQCQCQCPLPQWRCSASGHRQVTEVPTGVPQAPPSAATENLSLRGTGIMMGTRGCCCYTLAGSCLQHVLGPQAAKSAIDMAHSDFQCFKLSGPADASCRIFERFQV